MKKTQKQHPPAQNIKVAVDNCIFTVENGELRVLLIQMKKAPFAGKWALPGGLLEHDESPEKAAKRILKAQTGVENVYLEQLFTFGKPQRDPSGRVVSIAYFALIPAKGVKLGTTDKYQAIQWWNYRILPRLAYDHEEVVTYAKKRLEWKIEYSNAVWSLLPPQFTLTELQTVYEAILGKRLDKRNFRKKVLSLNLVKPLEKKTVRGAHRPAKLHAFKSKTPKIIQIL